MTRSRTLRGLLPWLVAPAWSMAACGETAQQGHAAGHAGSSSTTGGTTAGKAPIGRAGVGGSADVVEAGAAGQAPTLPPGISATPMTLECDARTCESAAVGPVFVDPCCATDVCGLDTSFLALVGAPFGDQCQPKDQPGELDASCPTSKASTLPVDAGGQTIMLPISGFAGCCRANGTCGVVVNDVKSPLLGNLATLGLGCVDSAPFFDGAAPAICGSLGAGGAAGAGGVGAGGLSTGAAGETPGGAGAGGAGGAG